MHIGLRRGALVDPIVNGYTRLARGVVSNPGTVAPMSTGPGRLDERRSVVAFLAGVVQASILRTAPAGSTTPHTIIGIQLDAATLWIGESGATGGPEVRTPTGGILGGLAKLTDAEPFKLAIEQDGRLRAWDADLILYNGVRSDVARGAALMYQSSDGNADGNAGTGYYHNVVSCKDNALHFANCPALGSVRVTIGAEAPVIVNLDAAGAGALDLDYRFVPLSVAYSIRDAGAVEVAGFRIPASFGGDVIGHR